MEKRRLLLVFYLYALVLLTFTYFYTECIQILEENKPQNLDISLADVFAEAAYAAANQIKYFFWYQVSVLIISSFFCTALLRWVRSFHRLWILPFALLINLLGFLIAVFLAYFPGDALRSWYILPVSIVISAGILVKSILFSKASSEY